MNSVGYLSAYRHLYLSGRIRYRRPVLRVQRWWKKGLPMISATTYIIICAIAFIAGVIIGASL